MEHRRQEQEKSYLWISQAVQVRVEIVDNAIQSSRQTNSSDKQDQQHHIGKGGCDKGSLRDRREERELEPHHQAQH